MGDQGVGWLRRALKRTEEQAAEEGRSVEDVAAERWGVSRGLFHSKVLLSLDFSVSLFRVICFCLDYLVLPNIA